MSDVLGPTDSPIFDEMTSFLEEGSAVHEYVTSRYWRQRWTTGIDQEASA